MAKSSVRKTAPAVEVKTKNQLVNGSFNGKAARDVMQLIKEKGIKRGVSPFFKAYPNLR